MMRDLPIPELVKGFVVKIDAEILDARILPQIPLNIL